MTRLPLNKCTTDVHKLEIAVSVVEMLSASLKVSSYFKASIKDFSTCLCSCYKQAGKKKLSLPELFIQKNVEYIHA